MAEKKTKKVTVTNLECDVCGAEIVVSATGEPRLEPIQCCGVVTREIEVPDEPQKTIKIPVKTTPQRPARKSPAAKTAAKKAVKKVVKKAAGKAAAPAMPAARKAVRKVVKKTAPASRPVAKQVAKQVAKKPAAKKAATAARKPAK